MTYQMTRPVSSGYGNNDIRRMNRASAASADRKTHRPARMTAEEAARRSEAARRAEADRVYAERKEAYRIAMMEHERRKQARRIARIKEAERRVKEEQRRARAEARRLARLEARREEEALRRREIKVERTRVPMGIILGIAIAFILLFGVVYSFSEISESAAELSEMQAQLEAIRSEAGKYAVLIEEKNDFGVIEDKAVNELNMVKEGSVQKKYITVSDGDRIVIADNKNEEEIESYGGILSGISAAFEDILDYIR